MASVLLKLSIFFILAVAAIAQCPAPQLPVVDLGYELHRAFSLNASTGLYNFTNIRYAAPPLGNLRFRAPVPPAAENRSLIQTGARGRVCPQAKPLWETIAPGFLSNYLTGQPFDPSLDVPTLNISLNMKLPGLDPRITEDCLFLDVVVPKKVFDRTQNKNATSKRGLTLAPVLVWLYGGGYSNGDKSGVSPAGLIGRDQQSGRDGFVFVAINYRVGAFGWLAGDGVGRDGTINAGLHDQRLALEWVQTNIHLFGGDPTRVTVMGISAGSGSLIHQITAYGGRKGPAPFKQAILQSPGWQPKLSRADQQNAYREFLHMLSVKTLDQARNKSSAALIRANVLQIAASPYGTFTYGPTIDGDFVPRLPGQLLAGGQFDHELNIMTSHTANEGLMFTAPYNFYPDGLTRLLRTSLPGILDRVIDFAINTVYPAVFDGANPYKDAIQRAALAVGDVVFQCNTNWVSRAYGNRTYAYLFDIAPALHSSDTLYTFYPEQGNSVSEGKIANVSVAFAIQDYITSFVHDGKPHSSIGPVFEEYGSEGHIMDLKVKDITVVRDPTQNERCEFWQPAPFYGGA
ncbi:carboxylesterase family protein [Aspergillus campestris IBT 28561]|uniref:Carboxylic ester hydrolase n=1 Tax=Aspergillus campestris (strain IBT 28561) TaxID=1392248 RepID=A0A2I1CU03_ASPC2|nr:carboxylesterase family protein [Aspergillus campestris IBT 28561]PKY01112.1 carboxylesterase family protein [Aspergillus campestris IBT 28561]